MSMSAFAEETEAASEATTEAGSTAAADTTGGTTPLVVGSQNFMRRNSAHVGVFFCGTEAGGKVLWQLLASPDCGPVRQ